MDSIKINRKIMDNSQSNSFKKNNKRKNNRSFHLGPDEKQKFKEIIKDFDNIRYKAKKWTNRQFEIITKMNTIHTKNTNLTNNTTVSNTINTQENFKNSSSNNVFAKKKQEINKKILEISDVLIKTHEKSSYISTNNAGIIENQIKNSEKVYILSRLNFNSQHFPLIFKRLNPINSQNEAKKQETIRNDNKKNTSKTKRQLFSITTAISHWRIGDKSAKKQKKREKSLQTINKKKTLKDLGKALNVFLNKLKKLKLCPREVKIFLFL